MPKRLESGIINRSNQWWAEAIATLNLSWPLILTSDGNYDHRYYDVELARTGYARRGSCALASMGHTTFLLVHCAQVALNHVRDVSLLLRPGMSAGRRVL